MIHDSLESKVQSIVESLNKKGKGIPERVAEIPDFPYTEFSRLLADFQTGKAKLLRFSFALESSLFSLIASTYENLKANIGMLIVYGGILSAIVLAIFYSLWFLIAIPFLFIIGTSLTKNAYNSAVFKAAFSSEPVFCFLYYSGQISVENTQSNEEYYYHHD